MLMYLNVTFYLPCLCKVGPVCHDHSTEHDVILGEVTRKEVSGPHHGNPKHVGDLISMGSVCPVWPGFHLTVVVEGVEENRRLELGVQFGSGNSWGHPLVVREQSQEGLPSHVTVVPVSPVRVHELYGLPQDVFTLVKPRGNKWPCNDSMHVKTSNLLNIGEKVRWYVATKSF